MRVKADKKQAADAFHELKVTDRFIWSGTPQVVEIIAIQTSVGWLVIELSGDPVTPDELPDMIGVMGVQVQDVL